MLLKGYARDGMSDKDIAKKIGITTATFYDWVNRFPEFSSAIKTGRVSSTAKVEDNFYEEKLKGRTIKEKTVEKTIHRDADGNITGSSEHVRETERYIPADTTAMLFYLKCRLPQKYNDRINVTVDDKRDGKLADLIEGLRENDLHEEATAVDEAVADEPPETN